MTFQELQMLVEMPRRSIRRWTGLTQSSQPFIFFHKSISIVLPLLLTSLFSAKSYAKRTGSSSNIFLATFTFKKLSKGKPHKMCVVSNFQKQLFSQKKALMRWRPPALLRLGKVRWWLKGWNVFLGNSTGTMSPWISNLTGTMASWILKFYIFILIFQ